MTLKHQKDKKDKPAKCQRSSKRKNAPLAKEETETKLMHAKLGLRDEDPLARLGAVILLSELIDTNTDARDTIISLKDKGCPDPDERVAELIQELYDEIGAIEYNERAKDLSSEQTRTHDPDQPIVSMMTETDENPDGKNEQITEEDLINYPVSEEELTKQALSHQTPDGVEAAEKNEAGAQVQSQQQAVTVGNLWKEVRVIPLRLASYCSIVLAGQIKDKSVSAWKWLKEEWNAEIDY